VDGGKHGLGQRFVHLGQVSIPIIIRHLPHLTSYFRSVHNTHIERLWYDVTQGFGLKWKNFFLELEVHHGLNPRVSAHIWLLHHLFHAEIDRDAQEWSQSWNSHKLTIAGERSRSPHDIFLFSMLQDGPRGIRQHPTPPDEPLDDPASYGVDWDVVDNPVLMNHLLDQNPQDWEDEIPFTVQPTSLSEVKCEPPNCPFSREQVDTLDAQLAARVDLRSCNMQVRRLVWVTAFDICTQLQMRHHF
jgi:hypothetical protein